MLVYALAAVTLTVSVAGFWAGTEFFLGNFKRRQARVAALSFVLFGCAVHAAWTALGQSLEQITALSYGLSFLWVGGRLAGNRNQYRSLGLILVVRGVFNLANGLSLVPSVFEAWFIWSFLVKASSMLCLIHAVQEKIQKRYTHAIESLSKAANYDSVTGLLNRHGLSVRLDAALARAREGGTACAVLFVDIDKFKRVGSACFTHPAHSSKILKNIDKNYIAKR